MQRAGEVLICAGAVIFITGACALDSDGAAYKWVLSWMLFGAVLAFLGYGIFFIRKKILQEMKKAQLPRGSELRLLKN